ncbi:MAG: WG repeat-containing protein [Bacteroidota bacterium]
MPHLFRSWLCFSLVSFPLLVQAQLFEIKSGDRWGFINSSGEEVVPPTFDFIYSSEDYSDQEAGYFAFLQDGKMGMYHQDRGIVVPPQYDRLRVHLSEALGGYIEIQLDGKIGLLDTLGTELIAPRFTAIRALRSQVYSCQENGNWGVWAPELGFSIPAEYEDFRVYLDSFIVGWQGDWYSAWNPQGEPIVQNLEASIRFLTPWTLAYQDPLPDSLRNQWEIAADSIAQLNGTAPEVPELLEGLLDSTGQVITPPIFDTTWIDRGYLYVQRSIGRDTNLGLYSLKGTQFLEAEYANLHIDRTRRIWMEENFRWGIMDQKGNWLSEIEWNSKGNFQGNAAVVRKDRRMGVINQFGEKVVEPIYREVKLLGRTALVWNDTLWKQVPLTEEGLLAFRRRLIVQKKTDEDLAEIEEDLSLDQEVDPRDYGWFLNRRRLWGWRDSSRRVRIRPEYSDVFVYPELGLTMAIFEPGKVENRQCALVDHRQGRLLVRPDQYINVIYMDDFASSRVARAQFVTGAFTLIDRRGSIFPIKKTAFIGPMVDGIASACQSMIYLPLPKVVSGKPEVQTAYRAQWGYLTEWGQWGLPAKYEAVKPFSNGFGAFQFKGKWGAVDTSFEEMIPPMYDAILASGPAEQASDSADTTRMIIVQQRQKKIFYLDMTGNVQFSRLYEESQDFEGGLVAVKYAGKWGYLDQVGKLVVQPQFDRAGSFVDGLARVRRRMRWGYIDPKGEYQIEPIYHQAGDFVDGIARVKIKGKYGFLNRTGAWHIRPRFQRAEDFYQGRAIARGAGWKGVIDTDGNWLIPARYAGVWRRGEFFRVKRKGLYGYFNLAGEPVLEPRYRLISERFVAGRSRILQQSGWGIIDTNFQIIAPPTFQRVRPYKHSMAAVKSQGKWGLLNLEGDTILPMKFDDLVVLDYAKVKVLNKKRERWEVLDLRSQMPPRPLATVEAPDLSEELQEIFGYDEVHPPSEDMVVATCNQLLGLVNERGEVLFSPMFEQIHYRDGLYQVILDGNIGYLNSQGTWVYPIPLNR